MLALIFFSNPWYYMFTCIGFIGFWAAKIDKIQTAAKGKGIPFHLINCMKDYLWPFIISGILTFTGNMILVEHSNFLKMESSTQYLIISCLAWGGGSGFKYAVEKGNLLWKRFVDKWTSK